MFKIKEHSFSWLGKPLDIWAMGITLYAFVYGFCPFEDESIVSLRNKILYKPVSFPDKYVAFNHILYILFWVNIFIVLLILRPDVSLELKDLIVRLLTKDPTKRITLEKVKVRLS